MIRLASAQASRPIGMTNIKRNCALDPPTIFQSSSLVTNYHQLSLESSASALSVRSAPILLNRAVVQLHYTVKGRFPDNSGERGLIAFGYLREAGKVRFFEITIQT